MKAEELTNEELADVLREIKCSGVPKTIFENECMEEAITRIEYLDIICYRIKKMVKQLESTNALRERVDKGCIL